MFKSFGKCKSTVCWTCNAVQTIQSTRNVFSAVKNACIAWIGLFLSIMAYLNYGSQNPRHFFAGALFWKGIYVLGSFKSESFALLLKLYEHTFFTFSLSDQYLESHISDLDITFHWYPPTQCDWVYKMMCKWRRQGHSCLYGAQERITLCLPSVAHCSVAQNLLWLDSHDIIRLRPHSHWLKVMSCFRGRINGAWTPPLAPCDWPSSVFPCCHNSGLTLFVYSLHKLCVLLIWKQSSFLKAYTVLFKPPMNWKSYVVCMLS